MKESPRSFLWKLCPIAMSGLLVGSVSVAQDTNAIAKSEAKQRCRAGRKRWGAQKRRWSRAITRWRTKNFGSL